MAGKPGLRVIDAMLAVVDDGLSPYAAAIRFGIYPSTVYDSVLFKAWKAAGYDPHRRQAVKNDLIARRMEACKRKPRKAA